MQAIGLTLRGVTADVRYDGSPVLKVNGRFMAGLSQHPSAEPGSLVVRIDPDDRARFIDDAPDVYYVTAYHERHPVVLVRLSRISGDALHDLLDTSRRLTLAKTQSSTRRERR